MYTKMRLTILIVQLLSATGAGLQQGSLNRGLQEGDPPLSVSQNVPFGKDIIVEFNNPDPPSDLELPYIAIFEDEGAPNNPLPLNAIPEWEFVRGWLNDCNTQEDCSSPTTKGSVTFSAADPKSYYYYEYAYGYFPLRDGKYVVCYLKSVITGPLTATELISDCLRLEVEAPTTTTTKEAKIKFKKTELKLGKTFKAKFKTPIVIPNQWVGLYPEENGGPPTGDLTDKEILWGYTSCKTQNGDQKETTNCLKKKKKGTVKLNKKHVSDTSISVWPVPEGTYYICINFHSNEPYDVFKCSDKAVTVKGTVV